MLDIRLLGEMEVTQGGERLAMPPSKKTRGLLAYLALAGRPLRREHLCTLLWEVPDDPKGALRWSLSKLRSIVDEPGSAHIVATRETVVFEPGDARVDFAAAKAALARGPGAVDTPLLMAIEKEFRGEFLEGLELADCHDFEAWRIAVREEARRLHADVLSALVERLGPVPETALAYARSAVRLDPSGSDAHATLLRLLVEAGQREAAEEQYAVALRQLEAYGVPSGFLTSAWRDLRRRMPAAARSPPAGTAPRNPAEAPEGSTAGPPGARDGDPVAPAADPSPAASGMIERKHVTVLTVSVSEPDASAFSVDPESALERSDPLLDAAVGVVDRFEGAVAVRAGDCLTAVFGAPVTHEDDAVRACFAALAVRAAFEGGGSGLLLRIGLHSGEVVVRSKADRSAAVEAVGPVVKVAERIERSAASGTIVLTQETLRRAEGFVRVRSLSAVDLGAGAMSLYILEGKASLRSRWQVRAARGLSGFVGRQTELETMRRCLARVEMGHGEVVALVGGPGMGKSRLVHEFLRRAVQEGWAVHETSTTPYDVQASFLPIMGLLRDWFEIHEWDAQTVVADKVEARARAWFPDPEIHLPALKALLDLPVDDAGWKAASPQQQRRQTLETIRTLVTHQSRRSPLILVVEDLHWVDTHTQAVLDALVEGLGALRILLLVTFRPGYRHGWGAKTYFCRIRLDPFTPEEVGNFLEAALGPDFALMALKRRLAARTEGTPLFLEEAIMALSSAGAIVGKPGSYRPATASSTFELPSSIQAVIASRIDRLPGRAKAVLQVAAVIGRDVPVVLLRRMVGLAAEDLHEILAELQSAEFLFETRLPPELEYTFKHALTHEVAYSSVLRERRRELHTRLVGAIEELYADRLDEQVDHLARHAAAGGLREKAIRYLFQSAGRAIRRSAHLQAIDLLKRGLEIIAELPETPALLRAELDYQKALGVTLMAARGWGASEVSDAYTRARELSERIGDSRELFVALRGQGQFHMIRGELGTARAVGERCIALFAGTTDRGMHIETHHLFWSNSFFMGAFGETEHHAGQGIAAYRRDRDHELTFIYSGHDPGVCCRVFAGLSCWQRGQPDAAVRRCREALALAEDLAHPLTLALAYWGLSYVHLFRREPAEAQRWAELEIALCERYLLPLLLSQGRFQLGWALAELGRAQAGIARMEEGLEALQATGAEMGRPYLLGLLGEAYARMGKVDEGLNRIHMAQEAASPHGAKFQLPEILRLKGELLLMGDEPEPLAAEGAFIEALSIARGQGARLSELRIALSLDEARETPDFREARELMGA